MSLLVWKKALDLTLKAPYLCTHVGEVAACVVLVISPAGTQVFTRSILKSPINPHLSVCVGGSSHARHRPQTCLGSRRSTSPFSLFRSGYVLVSVSQVCQRSDVAAPHNHCSENKLNCGCDRAEDKSVNSTRLSNSVSFLCRHPGRGALRSELLRLIQPVACQSPSFLAAAATVRS